MPVDRLVLTQLRCCARLSSLCMLKGAGKVLLWNRCQLMRSVRPFLHAQHSSSADQTSLLVLMALMSAKAAVHDFSYG